MAGGERPGLRDAPGGLTQTLALARHAMEREEGRNQDDAALGHEPGARLVDQRAVLDRVGAGLDGLPDVSRKVRVDGEPDALAVSLVADRPNLLDGPFRAAR